MGEPAVLCRLTGELGLDEMDGLDAKLPSLRRSPIGRAACSLKDFGHPLLGEVGQQASRSHGLHEIFEAAKVCLRFALIPPENAKERCASV